jgi:hypothetical protein
MIRLASFATPFLASPNNTIEQWLLQSTGPRQERQLLQHLMPGFPRNEPPQGPPARVMPPIPTDVPMPQPMDVPLPEPRDVPPPDPGRVPNPAKPRPDETNPRPRSVP